MQSNLLLLNAKKPNPYNLEYHLKHTKTLQQNVVGLTVARKPIAEADNKSRKNHEGNVAFHKKKWLIGTKHGQAVSQMTEYFRPKELAEWLDFTEAYINKLRKQGKLIIIRN